MVSLPLAYIVHNIFGLIMISSDEKSKKPTDDFYKNRMEIFLSFSYPLIFLTAYHAYMLRILKYYFILDPFNMEILAQNTWHSKLPIVIFFILGFINITMLSVIVIDATKTTRKIFICYYAVSCLLIAIILPFLVYFFLKKLKMYFFALYQEKK